MTEVLVEMIQQKREVFQKFFLEALEEVGLGNAITEGRKDDFVSENKMLNILEAI